MRSWPLIAKRLIDLFGAILGMMLLSPLFLMIYILLKMDSPGPALYRRILIGFRGRPFVVYKFRSMVVDAHQMLQNNAALLQEYQRSLKITNDSRVTRVGRFLRKTSLDELPQLFNIIRGDMSLVGPRMLGDLELARYGDARNILLSVKPGLTGLWQVSGRHTIAFDKRMELDLYYVEHWDLLMDINILLKTVPAVLNGTGAE